MECNQIKSIKIKFSHSTLIALPPQPPCHQEKGASGKKNKKAGQVGGSWRIIHDWLVVSSIFYFHPYLGQWSNLTNIFEMDWNHQLDDFGFINQSKHGLIGLGEKMVLGGAC